ncbi:MULTISPECIES: hypothetical protein [Acinetobacter]|uniref:hypothetical protein n=1 Tax=Acinetobacter TaxID=469 RepID=UPI00125037D5|nr:MULTISPECIES: hypothetical protein [Acinetobacter]URM40054.1 hypothetical protein K6I41_13895 [Acinetobacter sp. AS23]
MSFNFENLNQSVREKMLKEIQLDISNNNLYLSKRFSQKGIYDYPDILMKHVASGDEVSLGSELNLDGRFNSMEQTKTGIKKVPFNAHETLAEDQFNRFYVRALCLVAIETNKSLQVYRAKSVSNARTASQQKIGELVDPIQLLNDLRSNGLDTALGLPAGPNSGLSVKLI